MTPTLIGSVAAIRYIKDIKSHLDYWHAVAPAFQVAYIDTPAHIPYVLEYAAALPETMIVARIYHQLDGGFHLKPTGPNDTRHFVSSPAEYLQAYGDLGKMENIILNVMNEPNSNGSPDEMLRMVNWFMDYIPLAASIGCKSVLFNWADRNPQIINGMMDSRFDNILRMMAVSPELFFMGLHFYGPDTIHEHLDSYVARCNALRIKPPTVIGTEFGIDSIQVGSPQRGYKTWPNYKDIYGGWLLTQVKPTDDPDKKSLYPHIKSGVLGGVCIFQEGNSGGFEDFDFETDQAVKDTLKKSALAGEIPSLFHMSKPPPQPQPPPVQPPPLPPSATTIPIDLLKDIASSLKNQANTLSQLSTLLANSSSALMADYTLIQTILDKIGSSQ